MLIKRIITAFILIPIVFVALFYFPVEYFGLFSALIALGAAWEWSNLMELQHVTAKLIYILIMILFFILALYVPVFWILVLAFSWWIFAGFLILKYPKCSDWWRKSTIWRGLMGVIVILPCWVSISFMREFNGPYIILFLFFLIWGADTIAYFVGKAWGKTKPFPLVSPGKSLQGYLGALIYAFVLVLITLYVFHYQLIVWPWVILFSILTVLFSIVGDLFESMLKRNVNIKNSGSLLPGHGGLLDRIDSLTAACPTYALFAILLGLYIVDT